MDPVVLINEIYPAYLPRIAGIGHSWDCILNGRIIATVTVDGVSARVTGLTYDRENHLHFVYRPASY